MHTQLTRIVAAPLFVASIAAAASAGPSLVSYRFGTLSGQFALDGAGDERESAGGLFTAEAVVNNTHVSSGDITRLDHRPSTGEFNPGFAAISPFSVLFTINVTNIAGTSALGTGSLSIADADGDTLTADIAGVFSHVENFLFFNGISTNYEFSASDDSFDGTNGAIMIDDLVGNMFAGSTSFLIHTPVGLTQSFADATTNVDGEFVPSPAGVLAIIAGFGMATRRRR
ncbi:MAG: hypothetical protein K8E66_07245 [Phycisphaerales bacterium]|nr:hypothetical protein [Phycisphaerales bacterium]